MLTYVAAVTTDSELIVASWTDPSQFAGIFDRHYPTIHRFAVGMVGVDQGTDVAAEVFVRAFETRGRFDPTFRSARPWLFGIASNLVNDFYRKRAREVRAYRRAGPPEWFDPGFETEVVDRLSAAGWHKRIVEALGELRSEEAQVVLLFVVAELSYAEIAEATGVPIGTVRSRLSRARAHLRILLWSYGESQADE